MRISINEITDYIKCPLMYKFMHVDRIIATKTPDEYYKEYLKLAISFYYFSMIEKKNHLFELMLRKWGSLWFNSGMVKAFKEDYLKQKSNEAVMLLTDFNKKIASERATPIAVNFPYEAVLPGIENIHITGNIDLIKILNDKTRQRETQIVFLCTSKKIPDDFMVKNRLSVTVASYVFRKTFKIKEDRIKIVGVAHKADTETMRTGGDFNRAEKIIRNICTGIANKVFYPRTTTINCANCRYKAFCINERALN